MTRFSALFSPAGASGRILAFMPAQQGVLRFRIAAVILAGATAASSLGAQAAGPQPAPRIPPAPARTQPADSAVASRAAPAVADSAPLVVQNRTVFVFRAPLGSRTALERAEEAARRVRALAESSESDTIVARPIAQGVLIAGGRAGRVHHHSRGPRSAG